MATFVPPISAPLTRAPTRARAVPVPAGGGGRHFAYVASFVVLLVAADAVAIYLTASLVRGVRDDGWAGAAMAQAFERLLPGGAVPTAQVVCAVLLSLAVMNTYGAALEGKRVGPRLTGASLGLGLPYWHTLWNGSPAIALTGLTVLGLLTLAALVVERRLLGPLLRSIAEGTVGAARVLLVGEPDGTRAARGHPALADRHKFMIVGTYDPEEFQGENGRLERICRVIRRTGADTVALCGPLGDAAFQTLLDAAVAMGCELVALRSRRSATGVEPRVVWSNGAPLMALTRAAMRTGQLLSKRAIDLVGAAIGLLMLMPAMVLIAVAIRLESPGPVLFAQSRVGTGGYRFRCLKFRTMRADAERQLRRDPQLYAIYRHNNFKLPEALDPRITRIGRLLRLTSLDELPQLWNVLRGEMSLVGPRPVVPEELDEYREGATVLLSFKPGMSGAWAVLGRSRVGYPERAEVELAYVRQWRFGLDLSILARTVPAVLLRRGAH
jgi:exopolysaccharide biosynthesis polyprenyl glycosylphosphotransferase